MGVEIITGNSVGDSFGKGLLKGIDEKKAEIKEQKLADEYVSVVAGMIDSQAESVKSGMEPAYTPPATQRVSAGKWGAGEIPSYAKPIPNPLEGKADEIAEGLVLSMQGLTDLGAIQLAGTAAAQQLEALKMQEVQARLAGDLRAAAKGGLVDQAEVEQFAGMLEAGEDPVQVYKLFSEVRDEAVREQVNTRRTVRFIESGRLQEAALRQTADTIVDPEEKAWATAQAQELAAKLDEIEIYASGGIDSFDFDSALDEVREIKNRLNPYQQLRMEEREMEMRSYYDARERVLTDTDVFDEEKRAEMLAAIDEAYGGAAASPTRERAPVAAPSEATPEQRAKADVKARAREAESALSGQDPFAGAETPEDIEGVAFQKVGSILFSLLPEGTVLEDVGDDSSALASLLIEEVRKLEAAGQADQAARILGQLRALGQAQREAEERVAPESEDEAAARRRKEHERVQSLPVTSRYMPGGRN